MNGRPLLLWQIADLLRQIARQRVWWAAQEPETYGGYLAGLERPT